MSVLLYRIRSALTLVALLLGGFAGILGLSGGAERRSVPAAPAVRDTTPDLTSLLGLSGNLRAIAVAPGEWLPLVGDPVPSLEPPLPGVHLTGLVAPDGMPIQLLALYPLEAKAGSVWRGYRVGYWPGERPERRRPKYRLPAGFVEVSAENQDLPISRRFTLGDFVTHDQVGTWPKMLVLQLSLPDKLELIAEQLTALGKSDAVRVMSGFRTPQYNALGVAAGGGRARDSRHMYGDAADIFVDGDGDGRMDDLTGDGRVSVADARFLAWVTERVELDYPDLVGGIGVYRANPVHGPFVHVDVRGERARW